MTRTLRAGSASLAGLFLLAATVGLAWSAARRPARSAPQVTTHGEWVMLHRGTDSIRA